MNSTLAPALHGKRGVALLHDPLLNKGTAFTDAERDRLGLRGLVPPRVTTQSQQIERVLGNLRRKDNDLERYISLMALQERNETLFYRVVIEHLAEMMPLIYTPTVGLACQRYGAIFRRPRGLYVSSKDRGRVRDVLMNWPHHDVRIIVVTDGERILGLGDLGAHGMGIPVGKLALYTACAGIRPEQCLPVMLDVGTNNKVLLGDPLYLGTPEPRLRGAQFDELVEEFVAAVQELFPRACLQFEDFGNANAFRLLQRYREAACVFNDDIQGTAAVALAGILSAQRLAGKSLAEQRILFVGAGEAGIGIGDLVVEALKSQGVTEPDARHHCWFIDSKGLVVRERTDLVEHKRRFAHDHSPILTLLEAVQQLQPTVLVGVSGMPGTFDEAVIRSMARCNERPVVFALSNPTSKSECTAAQAYNWSEGRAIFASGSPFPPVTVDGRRYIPGQGNNSYIFPGVGLGVTASESKRVTDEMFLAAANTLAEMVSDDDLKLGRVYPDLMRIREVSLAIATAVAEVAFRRGLTDMQRPDDLEEYIRSQMFVPRYEEYV
jgi:malate dehydrogenase (oxaloacetate-decarboxylating)(NADP+)